MRYLTAFCLSAAVSMAAVSTAKAQGESDPGLSQVGSMRTGAALVITEDDYENNKAHFSIGHTFAQGEKDVVYNIPQVELRVPVLTEYSTTGYFDVRLPIQASSGELGNKWGIGDLTVAYTHMLKADPEAWSVQATGGILFGLTTANQSDTRSRPLPMSYQSSMGSTDLMAGVNVNFKQYLSIAAGYQQPVIRYNENDYTRASVFNDPIYSQGDYTVGRKLYRYGDAMMRVEGHLVNNRAGLTLGALGLYHVRKDLYEDQFKGWQYVNNSDGLTVSMVGNAFLRFGRYGSCKLDITGSLPVVTRSVRPDGLERQWTIMPRFTFFFNQRTLLF